VDQQFGRPGHLRSVPGAGFPPSATHHCGLPATVKVGAAGSAAAHHVGVSLATIIRASSCRASERPSCTLRPCLRETTAAGRAPGRREAVHFELKEEKRGVCGSGG